MLKVDNFEPYTKLKHTDCYYRNIISNQFLISGFGIKEQTEIILKILEKACSVEGEESVNWAISELNKLSFLEVDSNAKAYKAMLTAIIIYNCLGGIEKKYNQKYFLTNELEKLGKLKNICLSTDINNVNYLYNFALIELKLGNIKECVGLLEMSLSKNHNLKNVCAQLALIYTIEEIWPRAEIYVREAIRRGEILPSEMLGMCLTTATFKQGKNVEGSSDYSAIKSNNVNINEAINFLPEIDLRTFDHSKHGKPIILIPSDSSYFLNHSLALVLSLYETKSDVVPHLHIMNPTEEVIITIKELKKKLEKFDIYYSTEVGDEEKYGGKTVYYPGTRLIRLYQMLKVNKDKRISLIDADSLFKNPIDKIDGINEGDIALSYFGNGYTPYWEMINCAFYTWRNSLATMDFLERFAVFAVDNIRKKTFHWFSGQLAVSMLFDTYRDGVKVKLLDDKIIYNTDHDDNAVVWAVTNQKDDSKKYSEYKRFLLDKYGF